LLALDGLDVAAEGVGSGEVVVEAGEAEGEDGE